MNALVTDIQKKFDTANGQLASAQLRINSLDGNVDTVRRENQSLRTDLATNQTNLTNTAARVDELQGLNAVHLAEVRNQSELDLATIQQMNRDLINVMRADFDSRERANTRKQEKRESRIVARQIVKWGIEKALRQEQQEKMSELSVELTIKSAAFEILQIEHDQMADQIKHRFDIMTQAMSRNPTDNSVKELLRSNYQRDVSGADSKSNGDFIEVEQEM